MFQHFEKSKQAYGEFNNGDIVENKPIGFPKDKGQLKPYSNLFYWAHAVALKDSTIGLHPHRGFEILTIVLKGKIKHYDTLLSKWISLEEGDVQLIQSRSGISHSEAMHKGSKIFQIWFQPNLKKVLEQTANYIDFKKDQLPLIKDKVTIVGDQSPLILDAENVEISLINVSKGQNNFDLDSNYFYSYYLIKGKLAIKQVQVQKDDFFVLSQESSIYYEVIEEGKLLCIKSPSVISHPIY